MNFDMMMLFHPRKPSDGAQSKSAGDITGKEWKPMAVHVGTTWRI